MIRIKLGSAGEQLLEYRISCSIIIYILFHSDALLDFQFTHVAQIKNSFSIRPWKFSVP